MWIKCSECNASFELSREPDSEEFATFCPTCETYLNVQVKFKVEKSESQHKR